MPSILHRSTNLNGVLRLGRSPPGRRHPSVQQVRVLTVARVALDIREVRLGAGAMALCFAIPEG